MVDKDGDENFPNNYKKGRKDISSVPCNLCGLHEDGQKESLVCPIVKMKYDDEENYDQLFGDNIPKSLVNENENNSMTNTKKIMKMKKGRMMHKTLKKSTMLCTVMSEDLVFLSWCCSETFHFEFHP